MIIMDSMLRFVSRKEVVWKRELPLLLFLCVCFSWSQEVSVLQLITFEKWRKGKTGSLGSTLRKMQVKEENVVKGIDDDSQAYLQQERLRE